MSGTDSPPAWRRRLLRYGAGLALTGAAMTLAAANGSTAAAGSATAAPTPEVMRKWSRSCALCHVDGNTEAPRIGDAEAWQPRLAKGREVLLTHTIEGFNKMPPLGYCMACEAADFRALIDFMAGDAQ